MMSKNVVKFNITSFAICLVIYDNGHHIGINIPQRQTMHQCRFVMGSPPQTSIRSGGGPTPLSNTTVFPLCNAVSTFSLNSRSLPPST